MGSLLPSAWNIELTVLMEVSWPCQFLAASSPILWTMGRLEQLALYLPIGVGTQLSNDS